MKRETLLLKVKDKGGQYCVQALRHNEQYNRREGKKIEKSNFIIMDIKIRSEKWK